VLIAPRYQPIEDDEPDHGEAREQPDSLERLAPGPAHAGARRPQEHRRRDDQIAHGIAHPPGRPDGPEVGPLREAAEREGDRAGRRADRRAEERGAPRQLEDAPRTLAGPMAAAEPVHQIGTYQRAA